MTTEKNAPGSEAATAEQLKAEQTAETAKAVAAARSAERARMTAITGHEEAKGREKLASHIAMNTEMTAEDAIAMLKASPKEAAAASQQSDQFAREMARQQNARVAADGGGAEHGEQPLVTAPVAANVFAFRRECVAKARRSA